MQQNPLAQTFFDFQTADYSKKSDPGFGLNLFSKFVTEIKLGPGNFWYIRNQKIERNRRFAMGKQPMQEFLDLMGIDGKNSFINLDIQPPAIAPAFIQEVVGRFMEREERPTVKAIDDYSQAERQKVRDNAEWRMKQGQSVGQLSQAAGLPVEDPNAYTPEDDSDLELYMQTEHHIDQEIKFQRRIKEVMDDNNYEIIKDRALRDEVEAGFVYGEVYRDSNGNIKWRLAIPENTYFTYSDFDDFHDCVLMGELIKKKIKDLRIEYPNIDEMDWHQYYMKTTQDPKPYQAWNQSWRYSYYRPYDDALVEIFKGYVVTGEDKSHFSKLDNRGRPIVTKDASTLSGNYDTISSRIGVVYSGVYVTGADEMLEWKLLENQIKPHWALHEVLPPACIYMPQNRSMECVPVIERVETNIRAMVLDLLNMQKLKSQLRPDELAIDVTLLGDIDLGNGPMKPMEVDKFFQNTGKLYYKGLDDDGETQRKPPIMPLPLSTFVQKMQALMNDYNFNLQNLKVYLGSDPSIDSQSIDSRLSPTIQQNQVAASNRSTEFIYSSYINWLEGMAKRTAIMLWDDIVLRGNETAEIKAQDISRMVFDINISMLPTKEEQGYVDQLVDTAVKAGAITFEEGFKVRRIAKQDTLLAEKYLGKYQRRREMVKTQQDQANIQATAQAQQASNQQTSQNRQQELSIEFQGKTSLQEAVNTGDQSKIMSNLMSQAILASMQPGVQMPDYLVPLIQPFLQNAAQKQNLAISDNQMAGVQKQMQAQAVQQQIAQASQAQEDQGGQMQQPPQAAPDTQQQSPDQGQQPSAAQGQQ